MDKGFLNKVLGQIVRETEINDVEERVYPPLSPPSYIPSLPPSFPFGSLFSLDLVYPFPLPTFFYLHCRDVYGLNNEESKYVWEEYKQIIIDIIKNNG
jgi:hypothetical protein